MKNPRIPSALAVLALASAGAQAAVTDDQVQALEARIAQLEAAAVAPASAGSPLGERFKLNGFMSAGFGHANADGLNYDNGLSEFAVTHKADSIVGLQVEGKVNDKANAVLQLVARGPEEFNVDAEWAYVGFQPGDHDELRVGRLRTSFFLMSEYLEVGYAYPWARPPAEVYIASAPSSFDGISWRHEINAGAWQHDIHVNWGSSGSTDRNGNGLSATDAIGLGVLSSVGDWQLGLKVSGADVSIDNPLIDALARMPGTGVAAVQKEAIVYTSLGVQYDNGSLLAMAEATDIRLDGIIPDTLANYVTVGYRFGKVMPHLTWSSSRLQDPGDRPALPLLALQDDHLGNPNGIPDLCPLANPNPNASLCMLIAPNTNPLLPAATVGIPLPADMLARILEGAQDSVTLGVRYDVLPNTAVKFDWTRVLDTHGTFGQFNAPDGNLFYDFSTGAPVPLARPRDDIDVLRFVVDVVF